MKADKVKLIVCAFAALCLCSCINKDYDMSDLDTEMQLLPGLSVPLTNVDKKVVSMEETVLAKTGSITEIADGGTILIGKEESASISASASKSDIDSDKVIEVPGNINIRVSSFLEGLLPGVKAYLPLKPVLVIENPADRDMLMTAVATCGDASVPVGPVLVSPGKSQLTLADKSITALFAPVKGDLVISSLKFKPVNSSSNHAAPMAEHKFTFAVKGYAPLSFEPGDEIKLEYPWDKDKLASYDLTKLAEENGISIESCKVSVDVTNNIPLTINASAKALVNSGTAQAVLEQPVAPGTVSSPCTTRVYVDVTIPNSTTSVSEATVFVTAKVEGDKAVAITEDHTLSFQLVEAIFTSGIKVKP